MDYRNHFTSRAIKAIEFAQYAAQDLEQDYIGTEHILLGLLHEREGLAARAMAALGMSFEKAVTQIKRIVAREAQYPSDNPYYTPRAKRVMEGAVEEAQGLGHNYIGTEHMLIGMLRELSTKDLKRPIVILTTSNIEELRERLFSTFGSKAFKKLRD